MQPILKALIDGDATIFDQTQSAVPISIEEHYKNNPLHDDIFQYLNFVSNKISFFDEAVKTELLTGLNLYEHITTIFSKDVTTEIGEEVAYSELSKSFFDVLEE